MERLEERILKWPERHPALFKDTAFSGVRTAGLCLILIGVFLCALTLPEWYLDERKNHQFYSERLASHHRTWQETRKKAEAVELEVRRTWFSARMWDYRNLIYTVHVGKPFEDEKQHNDTLADWQSKKLNEKPGSFSVLHYLYNPGFFWDVAVLLPLSLTALCMAFYTLIAHLAKFNKPTKEGRQPYIPSAAVHAYLKCIVSPWTLGSCVIGGALLTAGNHGTGVRSDSASGQLLSYLLPVGYAALVPYLYIAWRGGRAIRAGCRSSGNSTNLDIDLLDARWQWVRWLFWATALVVCATLVLSFQSGGMVERITGAELSEFKPVQRIVKGFFYALGILAALWVVLMVVECARTGPAGHPVRNKAPLKLEERIGVLDDLALNEVALLEYFGVFATLTILSYSQSALFIWSRADAGTAIGISILSGLILVSLTLLVIPILYCWYFYVDLKRFDRWAEGLRARHVLSEKESQELSRKQNSRLLHAVKIVMFRWRSLGLFVAMFGTLFYVGGISGWLAGIVAIAR